MSMKILSLNCGSSSAKYQVYDWTEQNTLVNGIVERVTVGGAFIKHEVSGKEPYRKEKDCPTHKEAINLILETLVHPELGVLKNISEITAVGHRVVHGGEKFNKSVLIDGKDGEVMKTFKELASLAPLHNPPNILGIEAAFDVLPKVPHVAVMDTAFHVTMPPHTYTYAVPYEWYEKYRIRRYGFHGTSHLYVSKRAAVMLGKDPFNVNLITCHIGNGVSFTAVKNGTSYDHSMGFTPLEGLVMGTRSGDIDPAIIPYICKKTGKPVDEVESILNKKSGLVGITAKYTDRRDILAGVDKGDKMCKLAFDIEAYRIRKYIGAYAFALGKVDAIVFTAGVGEMSPEIRAKALEGLEELGIKIDPKKNAEAVSRNHEFVISTDDSRIKVFVIPTNEEFVFVTDVVAIVEGRYDVHTNFKYSFQDPNYVNSMREDAYKKELLKRKQKTT